MSNKREWVIEDGVFPENEPKIRDILGDRLIWMNYTIDGPTFSKSPVTDYIFYGSPVIGRRLQKADGPKALSWLYDYVYDCNYYLPYFQGLALNNPHMFVEAGTLSLLAEFLENPEWFIKQNSGYKTFTGMVGSGRIETGLFSHELLMLAQKKPIEAEWRFVIKDNSVLTYSGYGDNIQCGEEAEEFAKTCLSTGYDPAPMWTLDICRSEGSYRVLEVNSLLAAGWYYCDIRAIVEAVDGYN